MTLQQVILPVVPNVPASKYPSNRSRVGLMKVLERRAGDSLHGQDDIPPLLVGKRAQHVSQVPHRRPHAADVLGIERSGQRALELLAELTDLTSLRKREDDRLSELMEMAKLRQVLGLQARHVTGASPAIPNGRRSGDRRVYRQTP